MVRCIKFTFFILAFTFVQAAPAASPTEDFAVCLVDSLNGKERKLLAKWIFFAIAAHPEIQPFSTVTSKDMDMSDKATAKLITRLLTENCPEEFYAANSIDPLSVEKAFELVGQMAMQELLSNEDVMRTISNYGQYVDQDKINKAASGNE